MTSAVVLRCRLQLVDTVVVGGGLKVGGWWRSVWGIFGFGVVLCACVEVKERKVCTCYWVCSVPVSKLLFFKKQIGHGLVWHLPHWA